MPCLKDEMKRLLWVGSHEPWRLDASSAAIASLSELSPLHAFGGGFSPLSPPIPSPHFTWNVATSRNGFTCTQPAIRVQKALSRGIQGLFGCAVCRRETTRVKGPGWLSTPDEESTLTGRAVIHPHFFAVSDVCKYVWLLAWLSEYLGCCLDTCFSFCSCICLPLSLSLPPLFFLFYLAVHSLDADSFLFLLHYHIISKSFVPEYVMLFGYWRNEMLYKEEVSDEIRKKVDTRKTEG